MDNFNIIQNNNDYYYYIISEYFMKKFIRNYSRNKTFENTLNAAEKYIVDIAMKKLYAAKTKNAVYIHEFEQNILNIEKDIYDIEKSIYISVCNILFNIISDIEHYFRIKRDTIDQHNVTKKYVRNNIIAMDVTYNDVQQLYIAKGIKKYIDYLSKTTNNFLETFYKNMTDLKLNYLHDMTVYRSEYYSKIKELLAGKACKEIKRNIDDIFACIICAHEK